MKIGLDIGNGSIKAVVDGQRLYIPAYFKRLTFRPHELPTAGFVEYQQGDRFESIKPRNWYVGKAALEQDPENVLKIGDSTRGKVDFALEALFGLVSHLPYRPAYDLEIVASIHDAKTLGGELKEALTGNHIVKCNDYATATKVNSQVLAVREEGHPALLTHRSELNLKSQNIVLDIGNGTLIASLFGEQGRIVDRKPFPRAGVQRLIADIARSDEFTKYLQGEIANEQYIRAAVDAGSFEYGSTGFNFQNIYKKKLRVWVESSLSPAVRFLKPWRVNAHTALVIGGGALLPGIGEALTAQGFTVSSDPVWANASGLYEMSTLISKEAA
ncbi:hypothetical protein NIES2098_42120 [Calothrix sp. NIES-2098]|nr:hypothetical protein NIES2098_42120 [Calothrix sp. NIES-2098]